jgi:hypothetical protein
MVAHLRGGSVFLGKFVDDDIAHLVNKSCEQMENGTCPIGASRTIYEWFIDGRRPLAATCNLETYIEKIVQWNVTSPDFESKVCQLIDTSTPAEFGAYKKSTN